MFVKSWSTFVFIGPDQKSDHFEVEVCLKFWYLLSTGLSTAVEAVEVLSHFYLQVLSPQVRVKHWQQNINKTDDLDNKAFTFVQLVPLQAQKWPENFPRSPSTPPTPSRLLLPGCSPPLCSPAGLLDGKGWGDLLHHPQLNTHYVRILPSETHYLMQELFARKLTAKIWHLLSGAIETYCWK